MHHLSKESTLGPNRCCSHHKINVGILMWEVMNVHEMPLKGPLLQAAFRWMTFSQGGGRV